MPLRTYTDAVVLMTGGASGIGRAMSAELVRLGARVVLADLDEPLAHEAALAMGDRASAVACDVSDPAQVEAVVAGVFETHGRLDYLFNNAGIGIGGPVLDNEPVHWDRVVDVNLRGVLHGIQAAYPRLVAQGFGHIVNTASMAGFLPTPGFVSYGMTKHAVVGLSKGLQIEAYRQGIYVTALCPGFIRTPILTGGKYGGPINPDVDLNAAGSAAERFRPMDPDRFAAKTIRALRRRPRVIIQPWPWHLVRWLYGLAPGLVHAIAERVFDPRTLDPRG